MKYLPLLKFCIVAPTGSGKSTVAKLLQECFKAKGFSCEILKLAEPLYELQSRFYKIAGLNIGYYKQNHHLLEIIADQLRLINPTVIIDDFMRRYISHQTQIIINDDLRDFEVDWPILKKLGFITIFVKAAEDVRDKRLNNRGDLKVSIHSKLNEAIANIPADYVIENNTDCKMQLTEQINVYVDQCLGNLSSFWRNKLQ